MEERAAVKLQTVEGVNKSDYYSDILLEFLLPWLHRQEPIHTVLEIGTGRGYISIVLAKEFPTITSILATDIDETAIALAQKNVKLNRLQDVVKVKHGSLFDPAEAKRFDLIVSVPPQLPITKQHVKQLIPMVEPYHLTTSVGGRNGRKLVDKIIRHSIFHLNPGGILCFVHSDIIGLTESTSGLEFQGFRAILLGEKDKLLSETTLTRLSKDVIKKTGYVFRRDANNREIFTLGVVVGIYEQRPHQKHRSGKR